MAKGDLMDIVKAHGGDLHSAAEYLKENVGPMRRGEIFTHGLGHYFKDPAATALLATYISYAFEELGDQRDEAIELRDIDTLTGLPKRATLQKDFASAYANFDRNNIPFALMVADIDKFKVVNDSLGHLAGDRVLTELTGIMKNGVREGIDTVYRYGGDELAVLYSGVDAAQTLVIGEKLRKKVSNSEIDLGNENILDVTFSGGIYAVKKGDSYLHAFECADQAALEAKEAGRDRVVLYEKKISS